MLFCALLKNIHSAEDSRGFDIDRGGAFDTNASSCVLNTAEEGSRAYLNVNVLGEIDVDPAENGRCNYGNVVIDVRVLNVRIDTAEHRGEGASLKILARIVGIGAREENEVCLAAFIERILGRCAFRLLEECADDKTEAYDHDNGGDAKLEESAEAENITCGEKKSYADKQSDDVSRFVLLGKKTDDRGNDDEERPPAVKENVDAYDLELVQREDRSDGDEDYAP